MNATLKMIIAVRDVQKPLSQVTYGFKDRWACWRFAKLTVVKKVCKSDNKFTVIHLIKRYFYGKLCCFRLGSNHLYNLFNRVTIRFY